MPLFAPTRAEAAHGQRAAPSASSWSPPPVAAAAVAAVAGLPPPPRSACSRSCTSAAEAADCWAEVQAVVHRCRRPSTRAWPTRAARPRTLPRAVAAAAVEEAAEAAPSPPSRRQLPAQGPHHHHRKAAPCAAAVVAAVAARGRAGRGCCAPDRATLFIFVLVGVGGLRARFNGVAVSP